MFRRPHGNGNAAGRRGVSGRVSRLFLRLQDLYAGAIIRAQATGEIDPARDARTLAQFLVCQIQGMRAVSVA
jgi:TetR/AcrR family transcriptional regulator, transcriptional repressor for nem operon